jgi:arsenite methyltransferase
VRTDYLRDFLSHWWLAPVASILSLAVCYGTLAATTVLGALGVALTLNDGVWAGAIVILAWLALPPLLLRRRRHGLLCPAALATLGATLIAFVMMVTYIHLVEFAGVAFLGAGNWLDWRAGNRGQIKSGQSR